MTKSFFPFLIFVLSAFILMCAPSLFAEGMFMDGLMYATVAKNLAHGEGSFWFLKFSDTYLTSFHEHPPLIFGLQSLCFNIFGDSIFVERFFSFFTYLLNGFLMMLIFKQVTPVKLHHLAWLPLLLWILMPLVPWGAMNNMLENGMLIFILCSVLFYLKSLQSKKYFFLALSSFMLFLAFLSKGFTGLFSLSLPFWMWCFDNNFSFKQLLIEVLLLFVFLAAFFVILFVIQADSFDSLQAYYKIQVKASLQNVVNVDSRFFIVGRLITESLIALGISVLIFLFGRKYLSEKLEKKWFYFLLALGLSGVLPITLSLKQNAHYLLSALPFFALAFSVFTAPYLSVLLQKMKWNNKIANMVSISFLLVSLVISLSQKGNYCRDEKMLNDVKLISKVLSPHTTCAVKKEVFTNWVLQGYLYRYAMVNLSMDNVRYPKFILLEKEEVAPQGYYKLPLYTKEFDLYQMR